VVHRPKHDDWSLPKGKLVVGEHPLLAALREIEEETGCRAVPARPLGEVRYLVGGRPKRVRYWACRSAEGRFRPGTEVDRLEWLAPAEALRRLTADRDRAVVDRFTADPRDTSALVVVRHASAGDRDTWPGDDRDRPLDDEGERQAATLTAVLQAYGVQRAVSADVLRCRATLEPFAATTRVAVENAAEVTAGRFEHDPRAGVDLALRLAADAPAVLSGQREVIGDLLAGLLERLGAALPAELAETPKGSAVVLHLGPASADARHRGPELATVELLPPA